MDGAAIAAAIHAEIDALPTRGVGALRLVRRKWSKTLKTESAETVLAAARAFGGRQRRRWVGYELVRNHPSAFAASRADIERWVNDLATWDDVDGFGRILAGPAWLRGWLPDGLIAAWAVSPNLWVRRSALVATIALNAKTDGGTGDIPRTLAICERLVADREDMVVKALSWALRELANREPAAVAAFVEHHGEALAARVRREVRHKLLTGVKNRRRPPASP